MTGSEVYTAAISRLGYGDAPELRARALSVINQVYADLHYCVSPGKPFLPLKNLNGEIELPERAADELMPAGTAAFLAQSVSDGDSQQLWISIYNRKRAALTRLDRRTDVFPAVTSDI